MKKVDLLIIRSFIGPFVMTFIIVLFFFIMQFFYVYIDDLVGKGLPWYIVAELTAYLSTNTVPIALPLALLLSSIMAFGNLGENYELTALKSAGIPLLKTMQGMILVAVLLGTGSFLFSNYVLPEANLKFYTTLFDITKQKPALNIEDNVYYKDIDEYIIKIDKKDPDNRTIYGVYINDLREGRGDDIITAERGEMFTSSNNQLLVLKLYEGTRYQPLPRTRKTKDKALHLRTSFKEMEKVFDLSSFKMSRTSESIYRNHYVMMDIKQLNYYIDSLEGNILEQLKILAVSVKPYFIFKRDTTILDNVTPTLTQDLPKTRRDFLNAIGETEPGKIFTRAVAFSRNIKSHVENPVLPRYKNNLRSIRGAQIEFHRKFSLAYACIIMLMIGAPFGAIVRKGGLGIPILISVVLYIVFIVLSKIGENLAKNDVLEIPAAMWAPSAIMTAIAIFLTYKASNDSSILIKESYIRFFKRLFNGKKATSQSKPAV